jgi:hypothetical protein
MWESTAIVSPTVSRAEKPSATPRAALPAGVPALSACDDAANHDSPPATSAPMIANERSGRASDLIQRKPPALSPMPRIAE